MTTPTPITSLSEQIKAAAVNLLPHLRDYAQADEEGVMVLASRQAIEEAAELIEQSASLISAHEAREKELVEALEPFAEEASRRPWIEANLDTEIGGSRITNSDLRRAAKAVKGEG